MRRSRMDPSSDSKVSASFELPMDLVFDILSRLPVKTLLRLKSVCKSWYALIENPNFIKMQLSNSNSDHPTSALVVEYVLELRKFSMRLQCIDTIDNPTVNSFYLSENYPLIVGICDGLVCATFKNKEISIICNPSTRQVREISGFSLPKGSVLIFSGLGFQDDDYKLFKIAYSSVQREVIVRGDVYSMRSGSWREIDVKKGVIDTLPMMYQKAAQSFPVTINGVFYWKALSFITVLRVVSFDTNSYVFSVIAFPEILIEGHVYQSRLVSLKGELALVICHRPLKWFEMWVLNKKERSWTMKLRVEDYSLLKQNLKVWGCERKGNLVIQKILPDLEVQLFLFDPETHEITYLPFPGLKGSGFFNFYRESLLPV